MKNLDNFTDDRRQCVTALTKMAVDLKIACFNFFGAAKIENYSTSLIVSGLASSNFLLQVCDSKIE